MFYVLTSMCRRCNVVHVGRRVLCVECIQHDDSMQMLLDRARIATAMYSDMIDATPPDLVKRWETVLDADTRVTSMSEAITFRKRLELTAKTADAFGLLAQLFIQYREQCADVDDYARLLWTIDHERAVQFDTLRGV